MEAEKSGDESWHLAKSELERDLSEFEHALICLAESFYRIMRQSLAGDIHDQSMSAQDNIILQAIHTRNRPKSVSDLCRLLNRDDLANIQYSVRKLQGAGLVEKSNHRATKNASYRTTTKGAEVVDRFTALRRELIVTTIADQVDSLSGRFHSAVQLAGLLTGIYDHAARIMATRD
jgi:predicted MarR family transcription regulator